MFWRSSSRSSGSDHMASIRISDSPFEQCQEMFRHPFDGDWLELFRAIGKAEVQLFLALGRKKGNAVRNRMQVEAADRANFYAR